MEVMPINFMPITRTITRQNILEQYFEENNNTFIHTLQCHHHCP